MKTFCVIYPESFLTRLLQAADIWKKKDSLIITGSLFF